MKIKLLVISALCVFVFGALPAFAADSPPALPSLPPDEPTSGDTTTGATTTAATDTTDTTTTATTTKTAAATTSGPAETIAIIALVLVAVYGIKKYSDAKKYQL